MRHAQTSSDDIDLASLGRAAKRAFPRVALLSLLAGGATAGVMTTMLPQYTSRATVEIVPRLVDDPTGRRTDPSGAVRESLTKEAVNTHVRKILSTDLTLLMNKELGLSSKPEFNERLDASDTFTRMLQTIGLVKAKPDQTDEDRMLASYARAMKVAQIRDSNNIVIEFTTSDPQFSALGANKLGDLYKASLADTRSEENESTVARLTPQLARLQKELADADRAVANERARVGQVSSGPAGASRTILEVQLTELTSEQSKASGVRSEAEARSTAAKEQMQRGTAESNPDVQKSQIIPRLSEQRVRLERQVSELSATLMPGHPRMKQVQGDLSSLKRQIDVEVKKIVDSLARDAEIARDRERTITSKVNDVKKKMQEGAPRESDLKGLEDTAKGKRVEVDRVQDAINKARTDAGRSLVEAKTVQRALPMNEKVWPKPAFFGPLVSLAFLLVGLAWAVTRAIVSGPRGGAAGPDGSEDRIPLQAEVLPVAKPITAQANFAQVAVKAAAPAGAAVVSLAVTSDSPSAASSIASVADDLAARSLGAACRSLVTGDRPDVEAANEAITLAKSLASAGKSVVLVDWANGGAVLANLTGGARAPGIAQLIQGDAAFEDVLQRLADTDAHFVPSGDQLSEPSLVFDADRANLVLDALDEAYDHVIVYGDHQAAHALFEATQGRFDVGVTISDGAAVANGAGSSFLGFEVAEMAIYHIERRPTVPAGRRNLATRGRPSAEARA